MPDLNVANPLRIRLALADLGTLAVSPIPWQRNTSDLAVLAAVGTSAAGRALASDPTRKDGHGHPDQH